MGRDLPARYRLLPPRAFPSGWSRFAQFAAPRPKATAGGRWFSKNAARANQDCRRTSRAAVRMRCWQRGQTCEASSETANDEAGWRRPSWTETKQRVVQGANAADCRFAGWGAFSDGARVVSSAVRGRQKEGAGDEAGWLRLGPEQWLQASRAAAFRLPLGVSFGGRL